MGTKKPRCKAHGELMCSPAQWTRPGWPPSTFGWFVVCNVNGQKPCRMDGAAGTERRRTSAKVVEEMWKKAFMATPAPRAVAPKAAVEAPTVTDVWGPFGSKCYGWLGFSVQAIAPSVNHYVKHTRNGRHFMTPEAKAYVEKVKLAASTRGGGWFERPLGARYMVYITLVVPSSYRGDLDNHAKLSLDALVAAGVIPTDAAVDLLRMERKRTSDPTGWTGYSVSAYSAAKRPRKGGR